MSEHPGHEEPQPDVGAIMEQIRRSVEQKRQAGIYPESRCSADVGLWRSSPADAPIQQRIELLRSIQSLDLQGPPFKSHRPLTGWLIKSLKKLTRFWVRKYTDELFLRQSYFNAEAVRTIELLQAEVDQLRAQLEQLRDKR